MKIIKLGLIGENISSYSLSKIIYDKKINKLDVNKYISYNILDIKNKNLIPNILKEYSAVNVTIPYKKYIIKYIDILSPVSKYTGVVNMVLKYNNKIYGFNTDAYGFYLSFKKQLKSYHNNALVIGNGATSQTICYVLNKLNINYNILARKNTKLNFKDINKNYILRNFEIIINCTPLGNLNYASGIINLNYNLLNNQHYLYDLTYNPRLTYFIKKGKEKGASVKNGLEMLLLQANKSWEIWQKYKII